MSVLMGSGKGMCGVGVRDMGGLAQGQIPVANTDDLAAQRI